MKQHMIFDFTPDTSLESWRIVDDVVMGGKSDGNFRLTPEGHGLFSGTVSLENNGGFSSVRYRFDPITVTPDSKVKIRLKGDGKRYQFRVKHATTDDHAYVAYFETSGAWETVEITLNTMYPSFRGRTLDMPNFEYASMAEIAFLIANKKAENFELLLDDIVLE